MATRVRKEEKPARQFIYYLGIDAHQQSHLAVLADGFERSLGHLQISSHQEGADQLLSWLQEQEENYQFTRDQLRIGVEGGGRYRDLLLASLLQAGYQVYEVNPLLTKQRRGYRPHPDKDDLLDAQLVVEVLSRQPELLAPLSLAMVNQQTLVLAHLARWWEDLARQSARLKNQIKRLNQEQVTTTPTVKKTIRAILKAKKKRLREIQKEQQGVKKLLASHILNSPAQHLLEIKGVSVILAARISAHLGDIQRFRNLNAFIKYAGLAPLNHSSGQTKRRRVAKSGNRQLHAAFYLLALNQIRWNPLSQAYFQKKLKEGKTKSQALRSLMKRMGSIVYGLLKSHQPYHPPVANLILA